MNNNEPEKAFITVFPYGKTVKDLQQYKAGQLLLLYCVNFDIEEKQVEENTYINNTCHALFHMQFEEHIKPKAYNFGFVSGEEKPKLSEKKKKKWS